MAEAFPSAILDSVLKQLDSPFFRRNNKLNCCIGIQLRDLRSKLELIGAVIDDAELMGILFPRLIRGWLCELHCILHEVDDLLDEVFTCSMPQSGILEKVRCHFYKTTLNLKWDLKMKSFNKRLESIVKECYKCNLLVVEPRQQRQSSSSNIGGGGSEKLIARKGILRYDPDCGDGVPEMIGRDDDKEKVIGHLLSDDPTKMVLVFGPPGVGKTTLCQAIYNDERVIENFEVRLWFGLEYVKELSRIDFWKKIITTLDEAHPLLDTEEELELIEGIARLIGMRRILVVLDCHRPKYGYPILFGHESWFKLLNLAISILTTAYDEHRYITFPSLHTLYRLECDISQEHSWSIFKNTALVSRLYREGWIQDLGRKIITKCVGDPILLKGVATLLHGKESDDDMDIWNYFAYEFKFDRTEYVNMASLHCLFRIYHQSLGYLSLFSNDEVRFEALMNQFEANGFTKLSNKMQLRFKEAFLKPIEKDDWDVEKKYVLNWVYTNEIRELAGNESTNLKWVDTDLPITYRHVSISRPSSSRGQRQDNIVLNNALMKDVICRRSFLFLGKWYPIKMSVRTLDRLASNLQHLRVLDLQDLALKELPSSIGKLIHLRYLDVSRNDFRELPGSIFRLKNLQTLSLVYCDKLIKLPRRIKCLHNLKRLHISMCLDLTYLTSKIALLTGLQTLDRFVVSPHKGGLRYMEHLDSLSGHLAIELPRQWENSVEDAEKANLERKKRLTFVEFKWQSMDDNDDYNVLEKLKLWPSIENLFIGNFGGIKFPSWINTLVNLTQITISHCKKCKTLPPFHGFPKLKYLTLTSMMNIEYLQDNNNGGDASCVVPLASTGFFLSLYELRIGCMPKLKGWPTDSGSLSSTIKANIVEIWKCPRIKVMPPFCEYGSRTLKYDVILHDVSMEMLQSIDWRDHRWVKIISIKDMESLPDNVVANLPKYLKIEDCKQLKMFWDTEVDRTEVMTRFYHLSKLSVVNCREMKHMSNVLRYLNRLDQLEISRCSDELDCLHEETEDGMPWKALTWLQKLKIEGFEKLEAIPSGLRYIRYLWTLAIVECKSLKRGVDSLPREIHHLQITSCPLFIEEIKRKRPNLEPTSSSRASDFLI